MSADASLLEATSFRGGLGREIAVIARLGEAFLAPRAGHVVGAGTRAAACAVVPGPTPFLTGLVVAQQLLPHAVTPPAVSEERSNTKDKKHNKYNGFRHSTAFTTMKNKLYSIPVIMAQTEPYAKRALPANPKMLRIDAARSGADAEKIGQPQDYPRKLQGDSTGTASARKAATPRDAQRRSVMTLPQFRPRNSAGVFHHPCETVL